MSFSALSQASGLSESFLIGSVVGAIGFSISAWATKFAISYFPRMQERVNALDEKGRYNFYCLGPSTVHAFAQILGTAGFLRKLGSQPVTTFDDRLFVEYGWTGLGPSLFSGIFVGYLLADVAFLGPTKLGLAYTFHHFSASACWITSAYTQSMQFMGSFLQFNELSTVFMNIRQLLLTAGYDSKSKEVTQVSYAFFLCFATVRVLPLPKIVFNWVTGDFGVIRDEVGMVAAGMVSFFITCHVGLQSTWFSLMLRKIFGASKKTKKQ